RFAARQAAARRPPRPEPLLRGHRQESRRTDPRQDVDQRLVARMSETDAGPAGLAARLIRRPSIAPRDEGALAIVTEALEGLGFTCHRLVFGGEGSDEIRNLFARRGTGRPNLCFAGHSDVVPA